MRKSEQEESDSGGSNSDDDGANFGKRDGEEEADVGDEVDPEDDVEDVEGDEDGYDGEEGYAEDEGDSPGESDEQPADADEQPANVDDSFDEEDDAQEARRQQVSKEETDDVKRQARKRARNSDDSGSSGDNSKNSFNDSRDNRKNMKTLQSSVRDHELPLRIAYEQLDELAANAEKVKSAIEKNRSILNVQVRKSNSRYLRAAFAAWKLDLDWQKTKKRDILRAGAWRKKFLLMRAFKAWGKDHMGHGKLRRLEKSAVVIIQRHNLRRCWKAWVALIKEKLRDQEEHRKEKRLVKDLDFRYQEKICRRACNFMYRWRLRRMFLAFRDGCEISRLQDEWEDGIEGNLARKKLKRLHENWRRITKESNNLQAFLQGRLRKRNLRQFFKAWKSVAGDERSRTESIDGLFLKSAKNILAVAFAAWAGLVRDKKANGEKLRQASVSADQKMVRNAFNAFVSGCSESRRHGSIAKRASERMQRWRLNKAFQAWICYMQIQAQKKMARLQEHVVRVEKENDRLRVENQRLAHVIDSGNWGKERISELIQAGQVLTGERDALTRLLGRMQRQHSFALHQQKQHEEEVRELKRQLMGKKHLVRNKLLVKGASSFNSLIKAMKDDVLKNGNDPELLYTIEKLAMDEVTVFPDGDLRVKAMTNFDRGKGNWSQNMSPGSNPQAPPSSQPIQPAMTAATRASTPTRKPVRPRTPVKTRNSESEVSPSLSSKQSPGTPRYVRSKTPMRGRAVDHFDYDQKTRSSDPDGAFGIQSEERQVAVKGFKRDLGLHKKYPYQSAPEPISSAP